MSRSVSGWVLSVRSADGRVTWMSRVHVAPHAAFTAWQYADDEGARVVTNLGATVRSVAIEPVFEGKSQPVEDTDGLEVGKTYVCRKEVGK